MWQTRINYEVSVSHLRTIKTPLSVVTPIEHGVRFPDSLELLLAKYEEDIGVFCKLVADVKSSAELLEKIRSPKIPTPRRMSLLKMFRRCVSLVCDTEATKKIATITTESLVENFGHTFKPIEKLKKDFENISRDKLAALAVLIGEYDLRGQQGYQLTELFFDWFEHNLTDYTIDGPRRSGKDVELSSIFPDFEGSCPCDFVIRRKSDNKVMAVGFARYDSTRGGAQSDDRTGGNANKVEKARAYCQKSSNSFKIIFVAEGPGLVHKDTWEEACVLDGSANDMVRVATLKLAESRITKQWLETKGKF